MAKYLSFMDEQFDRRSWSETALNWSRWSHSPAHTLDSFIFCRYLIYRNSPFADRKNKGFYII